MLNRTTLARGFTLIELLITLSIVGIVLALGAPTFYEWIQNTQIRSAAESTLTGIKLARTEATKRNAAVSFQMMTTTDDTCALSATAGNWVVSVTDAAGLCDVADPDAPPNIIRMKASNDGTANAVYAASQSSVAFDALGRVTPVPAGDIVIGVTNPTGGDCVVASGPMRCLAIIVTPGGQARMCDPAVTDSGDARKC